MVWLDDRRGFLSDWVTQQWVRTTGRRVTPSEFPWLDGPAGGTRHIGKDVFHVYAERHGFRVENRGVRGLLMNFDELSGARADCLNVAPQIKDFYEQTSAYELDSWAEWCGFFKPFGVALSLIFSRRLQQLNIPLSPLDSSRGMSSDVLQLRDASGRLAQTAWVRELHATGNVLYAGSYSVCKVPGYPDPCVKVVFPLPNGNAIVLMKPEVHTDQSFSITSAGKRFGDPGFYFTLHNENGLYCARYVKSLKETIKVYPIDRKLHADHILWFFSREFLRLHYRMCRTD